MSVAAEKGRLDMRAASNKTRFTTVTPSVD